MGGRKRVFNSGAPPPSVWDVAALKAALAELKIGWAHGERLLGYLARRPEITTWAGVEWGTFRNRIPERMQARLPELFSVRCCRLRSSHESADRTTTKMVIGLRDGRDVETVIMRHGTLRSNRITVCVSSQIGCAMACTFCATGTMGIHGDLSVGEIVEQTLFAKAAAPALRNVVFMGMGEPLNNYDAVVGACRVLFDERGLAFGHGRVTVSTVGVTHRIATFARDEPRASLALSLHAPTQAKRVSIMPAAKNHDFGKLLETLDAYVEAKAAVAPSGRDTLLMVEYILLGGVNDTATDARALGDVLAPPGREKRFKGRAMVNLIAYNETPGLPYARPNDAAVRAFQTILADRGVLCCVRKTMGADVAGACGQLLKATARAPEIEDAVPPPPPPRARRRVALSAEAADPAPPAAPPPRPGAAPPPRDARERVAAALAVAGFGFAAAAYYALPASA